MKKKEDELEKIEIEFWKNNEVEKPESDSIYPIISKMLECGLFLDKIKNFEIFNKQIKVLELGGGQGWASCVLKKLNPKINITLTDISEYAIKSKFKWEKIFDCKIDNAYACKSSKLPEENNTFDLVFCYAAAHHFTNIKKTLEEIHRILKPNGQCIFFHEPTSSKLLYPLAYKRVNKKRPEVPENVLIIKEIVDITNSLGFINKTKYDPTFKNRGPIETIYYFILSKFSFLQKILPCTANFVFIKS